MTVARSPRAPGRPHGRGSVVGALAVALLAAGTLAACVTRQRHDASIAYTRHLQRSYQEIREANAQIEAENERLRELLALSGNGVLEAGYASDVDARLTDLRRMMESLGAPPEDVTILTFEGGYGYRLSSTVLFDSGAATLEPGGRELLLEMARSIRGAPHSRVWVRGHTDSDPVVRPETKELFPHGNLELSAARAVEVAALLASDGRIEESKLAVAGFGAAEPVASNLDASGKRRNRRVEIFVLEENQAMDRAREARESLEAFETEIGGAEGDATAPGEGSGEDRPGAPPPHRRRSPSR